MRMHRKDNLDARLAACADIMTGADLTEKNMKKAAEMKAYLDFESIFKNGNPVHLEIGCGKGGFVCGMAKLHPDVNFVAVEKVSNVIITACEAAKEQGLTNVHFINCPAEVLPRYIKDGSIARIYLNFSDPWPKKRHARRRLTSRGFFARYDQVLAPDGQVEFKTDNRDLFRFSLEEAEEAGWRVLMSTWDLHGDPDMNRGNVMTEYEEKFSAKGNPICKLTAGR